MNLIASFLLVTGLIASPATRGVPSMVEVPGTAWTGGAVARSVSGDEVVLFSQDHDWVLQPSFIAALNTHFTATPLHSAELSDDFVVDDPEGWMITRVGVEVYSPGRPSPPPVDVYFMADAGGRPSGVPACSAAASTVTLWEVPFGESRAEALLSKPCVLLPGHYWLVITMTGADFDNPDDVFAWGLQYVVTDALRGEVAPPVNLHPPVWRQPGGITACLDWTPVIPAACGLEDFVGVEFYGSVYRIYGTLNPLLFKNGFED